MSVNGANAGSRGGRDIIASSNAPLILKKIIK